MKKILILISGILCSGTGFAQRMHVREVPATVYGTPDQYSGVLVEVAKSTGIGDTFTLKHYTALDTFKYYQAGLHDSGYANGMNVWNDSAFAERYDINGSDSSVRVIGMVGLFGGKVNPASTKTINLNVWGTSYPQPITATLLYNGFPNNVVDSFSVPVTQLGIGAVADTMKIFMFSTPSGLLSGSFFAGYSMSYNFSTLNGDTIAVACTKNGERLPGGTAGLYTVGNNYGADTTTDTTINVQNATLGSDGVWYDNYTQNDSLLNNMAIFPIIVVGQTNEVKSVTHNNLTFSGNYPNPFVNSTHIRFSLAVQEQVMITVMAMDGSVLKHISLTDLTSGDHDVAVSGSSLPPGDYLYLIRTSGGEGMAGKMTKVN